jgi:hypothetical protein
MSQADSDGAVELQSSQSIMQYVIHSCPLAPDKFQGSVQLRDISIAHAHAHAMYVSICGNADVDYNK